MVSKKEQRVRRGATKSKFQKTTPGKVRPSLIGKTSSALSSSSHTSTAVWASQQSFWAVKSRALLRLLHLSVQPHARSDCPPPCKATLTTQKGIKLGHQRPSGRPNGASLPSWHLRLSPTTSVRHVDPEGSRLVPISPCSEA
jgi:hypothetical protein